MKVAERRRRSLAELSRRLARERVALERRQAFEAEARRQSLEAAAAATDAGTDEHALMRELDADLEEFAEVWK